MPTIVRRLATPALRDGARPPHRMNDCGLSIDWHRGWQRVYAWRGTKVIRNGCESNSMDLHAGLEWTLTGDDGAIILDSAHIDVPFFTPRVAVEVRVDEQSAHIVPARAVNA
ncbi:MAG: hypothetical protein ABI622_07395, partial [Chloroflexota bacterium]